jgi:hypothetical protein
MQAKLLLFSVIIMMVAIPVLCAREQDPRRGFRRMVLLIVAYNLFYLFALRFIYPRLV